MSILAAPINKASILTAPINKLKNLSYQIQTLVILLFIMAVDVIGAFAQSDVSLEIPVDEFISSTNTWVNELAPIVAIGTGITIAMALLAFIGNSIVKGFRGG